MSEGFVRIPESETQGVEILLRRIAAEPDAQGAVDGFGIEAHGLQHVTAGAFFTGRAL